MEGMIEVSAKVPTGTPQKKKNLRTQGAVKEKSSLAVDEDCYRNLQLVRMQQTTKRGVVKTG